MNIIELIIVYSIIKGEFKLNKVLKGFFIFLMFVENVSGCVDYEAQFNHVYSHSSVSEDNFRNISNRFTLTFFSKTSDCAASLKEYYGEGNVVEEKGNWLAYTSKVSLILEKGNMKTRYKDWIRLQFFIGISFECDLDSIVPDTP